MDSKSVALIGATPKEWDIPRTLLCLVFISLISFQGFINIILGWNFRINIQGYCKIDQKKYDNNDSHNIDPLHFIHNNNLLLNLFNGPLASFRNIKVRVLKFD